LLGPSNTPLNAFSNLASISFWLYPASAKRFLYLPVSHAPFSQGFKIVCLGVNANRLNDI